jgi:putative membrane protein
MIGWLGEAYLWVKALHVIFVIFWMAGLFILPRYLIHHRATAPGSPEDGEWTKRETMLRRMILTPASIISWGAGLCLAASLGFADNHWLWAKLGFVVLLTGYDHWAVGTAKKLARGERPYTDRALRLLNEVPALGIIVIVILVVVKPF